MARLTAKFIEENACCPARGQLLIRDDELKGFGLRLTKGSMSWILETRVDGQVKRTTLRTRRVILPDHKLKEFYRATLALRQKMGRDYLLILILTGLRKTEAAMLRWEDIDFESKTITVRKENTKNRNEFMLPMTDFVLDIMKRRRQDPRRSEFVFPGREGHLVDVGQSSCPP